MKSKIFIVIAVILAAVLAILWIKKGEIKARLQSEGYIEYTTDEAISLAYSKCSTCHSAVKITNYCFRCGPPFIVVVRNMRTLLALERQKAGKSFLPDISDAEAVVITQVWNALLGNWEDSWRKKDLIKMLEKDEALKNLLDTPPADRNIEKALFGKKAPGAQT